MGGLDGNKKDVNINKNISDNSIQIQTDSSTSTDEKIKLKLDFNEGFVFNKTFEKIIKFNKKLKKQGLYNSIKRDTNKNFVNNNEFQPCIKRKMCGQNFDKNNFH